MPDTLQLALGETYPRRIIGIGVYDCGDITTGKTVLELRAQFLAAEVVDIEGFDFVTQNLGLQRLHRKARIDKQYGVLTGLQMRRQNKRGKSAHHRPHGGDAALGPYVYV